MMKQKNEIDFLWDYRNETKNQVVVLVVVVDDDYVVVEEPQQRTEQT